MMRKFNLILFLSALTIGCSSWEKAEKEVLEANEKWIENFNNGNTTYIANAYTENAVMVAKPFGTFEGRKNISEFWTPFVESGATDLKYINKKVKLVTKTKAIISSDWSMNVAEGIITNETWVKTSDGWKLKSDHFEVTEQFNNKSNKQKATFVLVHSAWLGGWQWENVAKTLKENGHIVLTPDLPGHGSDKTASAAITMATYTKAVTDILDMQEGPVILVGHSFNGVTVSRVAELRPNKVKQLVYVTAFLLPNGSSFMAAVEGVKGSKAVDNFYLSDDKMYALINEDEMQNAFAHDISKEAFEGAKPYIVPEPAAPLMYKLQITEENFGSIPKYYIECTEDRTIPIEVQRAMYTGKVEKSYSLNSSHTPNFSQPKKLAEILLKILNSSKN